jgi:hypothetical protein
MFSFLFGAKKRKRSRCSKKRTTRRRHFRRSNVAGSSCNIRKRADCLAKPFCNYVSGGQGCKYIPGGRQLEAGMMGGMGAPASDFSMSGDENLGAFAEEAGISFFGRRRRRCGRRRRPYFRRSNVAGSSCNIRKRADCLAKPFCNYVNGGQGCKYIPGGRQLEAGMSGGMGAPASDFSMSGDEDLGAFAEEAGIAFFGRRRRRCGSRKPRRYNVSGSSCNRLRKNACKSAGCSYTKRGCRRKATYKLRESSFGRRRRRCGSRKSRRYNVSGSSCNSLKKAECKAAGCTYTKRGCRRKATYKLRDVSKSGFGKSKTPKALARQCRSHGIKLTMKRGSKRVQKSVSVLKSQLRRVMKKSHRRKVTKHSESHSRTGDVCRGKSERDCGGNPNCTYTSTGCRRKHGVKSKGVKYAGPMLQFGKSKKLPKSFVKKCRRYGVKTTMKRGHKRVQKSMSMLKKQLRRAMRSRR